MARRLDVARPCRQLKWPHGITPQWHQRMTNMAAGDRGVRGKQRVATSVRWTRRRETKMAPAGIEQTYCKPLNTWQANFKRWVVYPNVYLKPEVPLLALPNRSLFDHPFLAFVVIVKAPLIPYRHPCSHAANLQATPGRWQIMSRLWVMTLSPLLLP